VAIDDARRTLGKKLADAVIDGMTLGIGTGSTAACAMEAIGRRIRDEGLRLTGVPTSLSAELLCRKHGIQVGTLDEIVSLDLAFDGADEVDPHLNLIKGRGAAHSREKVVAVAAERFVVLADYTKRVDVLGTRMPVPVEILPMALGPVRRVLEHLGAEPVLRIGQTKDGPTVTDQGLWIVDARFSGIGDPQLVNDTLLNTPGVLDHGLFLRLASEVWFGEEDGEVTVDRRVTVRASG
jgi:ribose 5-phosphate isomerase A